MHLRIRPSSTIPICLDFGTNNEKFLEDPFYLGLRQKRVSDKEMTEFMDEFMHEMSVAFPKLMVQFEVSAKQPNFFFVSLNAYTGLLDRPRVCLP